MTDNLPKQMQDFLRGRLLKDFTEELCNKLLEKGFVVYRYDAYSTNSIYLKLDCGVCNSIRISDHEGKGYLKYRYNIGTHIKAIETKQDKYPRFYFPANECDAMVKKIVADRDEKVRRYGMGRYQQFMKDNKAKNANEKGFWSQAWQVF